MSNTYKCCVYAYQYINKGIYLGYVPKRTGKTNVMFTFTR